MDTVRSPSLLLITQRASSVVQTLLRSSDGSAWQSAPPRVPRLRTGTSAITRSASRKIGNTAFSGSLSSSSRCRVIAPIRTSRSPISTYASSSCRSLMSTRYSGLASRSFIMGSRLWPPATIRASSPSRSSSAMA